MVGHEPAHPGRIGLRVFPQRPADPLAQEEVPIIDVGFRVAGTDTVAAVNGFGVIFSDVDLAGSARLDYFDKTGQLLKSVTVPVRSDANGHSFAGAVFDQAIVANVRITAGQAAIAAGVKDISAGGTSDLVATDDFIAGEPHPVQ